MAAVEDMLGGYSLWYPAFLPPFEFTALLVCMLLAALVAAMWALWLFRWFERFYYKIPYITITKGVLIVLLLVIFLVCGWWGVLIAIGAAGIGLIPPLIGIKRVNMMGALLLPVIIFYIATQ